MSARASILPVYVPHLGCPHACVFCDQRRISGETEAADAEAVRAVLDAAAAAGTPGSGRQLAFYGGSFTAIPEAKQNELLSAAQEGIRQGIIRSIRLSTRPDAIDGDTLDRLRSFGVDTIELGAQSMDSEVLRLSGRGHTAEDVRRAARRIKEAGFSLILQMMTGLPGDSEEKSLYTAQELIALHPDGVRIYPTVVVRGTALHALWLSGLYREQTVEEAVSVCAKLLPLFEAARIPVIRLGLNPTDELSGGEAVAGAYHPALGELVRARILLEKARKLLEGISPGTSVILAVQPKLLSQLLGQHRCNYRALIGEYQLAELKIIPKAELPSEMALVYEQQGDKHVSASQTGGESAARQL